MQRQHGVWCVLCLVLLTGCVDVEQEMWVGPRGTARLRFDVAVAEPARAVLGRGTDTDPVVVVQQALAEFRDQALRSRLVRYATTRSYEIDGRVHCELLVDGTRLEALTAVGGDTAALTWAPVALGVVRFRQDFAPTGAALEDLPALQGGVTSAVQALLGDSHYVVRLHAQRVRSDTGIVSPDGRTAEWRLPLAAVLLGSATVLEAQTQLFDWRLLVAIGAISLCLAVGLLLFAARRQAARGLRWLAAAAAAVALVCLAWSGWGLGQAWVLQQRLGG